MIDPHKHDYEFEGMEASIDTLIEHLRILQGRTVNYDDAFYYLSRETQESFASLDLFMFDKIIEKLTELKKLTC